MSKNKNKNFKQRETDSKHRNAKPDKAPDGVWLYGFHAVIAALKNPRRKNYRLLVGKETIKEMPKELIPSETGIELTDRKDFDSFLPKGAVHQGIAGFFSPLPDFYETDLPQKDKSFVVILDQVTDPHNVGAVMRSAAAFGADALIVTERNAPEATGALAKAACGTLELIPMIVATNLSRTMDILKESGYWCVGMDGSAKQTLHESDLPAKVALVMGSEGYGMRRLTAQNCDFTVKLPISSAVESLNVSNAAAIGLYELSLKRDALS